MTPVWWPRFEDKFAVDESTDCWLWGIEHSMTVEGYGQFWLDGAMRKAHRVAYEALVGPIPEGLELDHVKERGCQGPSCVNPAHMEPVTQAENVRRRGATLGSTWAGGLCRKQLHDITNPQNVASNSAGKRTCRLCRDARMMSWRALT